MRKANDNKAIYLFIGIIFSIVWKIILQDIDIPTGIKFMTGLILIFVILILTKKMNYYFSKLKINKNKEN